MHRLYLHVGTHKTGTTSFQAWLTEHRADLAAHGINVLTEPRPSGKIFAQPVGFTHAFLRPSLMTGARMRGQSPARTLYGTVRAIAWLRAATFTTRCRHHVLSSEGFCFARTKGEMLRLKLAFRGFEVVPIVAFRNAADWRESWENQLTKRWRDPATRPFGSGLGDVRADWYYDREAIRRFWAAFGPVREIDYDAEMAADGSVLPALRRAAECPELGDQAYFRNRRRTKKSGAEGTAG